MKSTPRVCVVGSCNMDLISTVPRMPQPGETLHGERFFTCFGGKGANQAVMAAKLGAEVAMVGKVGADSFGRDVLENFKQIGVDTSHVLVTEEAATGVAPIVVNAEGQNSIIVIAGANDRVTLEEIEAARPVIAASDVLICQLEVPVEISLKALQVAREEGVMTILNPAPAKELPGKIYPLCDLFCPNESEAAMLTGCKVDDIEGAEVAAGKLLAKGCGKILLTLGARGALLVSPEGSKRFAAEKVKAVDSSGAGDCFVGSLAALLASGLSLADAVPFACRIATLSVLKPGTQSSYPNREDLGFDLPF